MAKGHKKVIRRSLTPQEWLRLRVNEIERWRVIASHPTRRWQVRQSRYIAPGQYEPLGKWAPVAEGDLFGEPDGTFFFRSRLRVPKAMAGQAVWLELATPTEVLVRLDGRIVNGFDPNRSRMPLLAKAEGGETFACELEVYVRSAPDDMRVHDGPGWGCVQPFRAPRLLVPDDAVEQFLYDVHVAFEVALCEDVDEDVREFLLHHLDAGLKLLDRDTTDRAAYHRGVRRAKAYLKEHIYEAEGLGGAGRLALVGHSHVDVAYHWSVRQGVRKNARTAAVQLALMEEYPDFRYCHSQPYLYEQLKAHYPDLFERVKEKVQSGQWELVGGMYVEPDCNVPSAESLIRQCLYGQLFYLREFGTTVDTCWLPDVFGNSWVMPQILAKSGIRYFISNKMSTWNDTNRFPHTNFRWRGVDGTEVLASVPASHFNCWLAPDQLLANWEGFQEKVEVGESMNMYGFGDGGGGATREILEAIRRMEHFPGLPRTRAVTGKQYLDEAFAEPEKLDVWDGELYLEMHRGVTTTKGLLKKLNRRCETAAREAELWSVLAAQFGYTVDKDALDAAWKQVLVNQFHDILPGSHTTTVGHEAELTYLQALAAFTDIKRHALDAIAMQVDTTLLEGQPIIVFNPHGWAHTGKVDVLVAGDGPARIVKSDGEGIPCQCVDGVLHFIATDVPPVGYDTYFLQEREPEPVEPLKATPRLLENDFFRIRLNRNGEITSLFDKDWNREAIPKGADANRLQLFEDKPGVYDAWDIVPMYRDKEYKLPPATSVEVVETGPVRAGLRVERTFLDSRLVQHIWIYRGMGRIDFETWVDWRERNKLLKVAFPVDVLSRRATFDLGYGCIERPTHRNTSWDKAKFEVCGHRWADLSEPEFGVSVLNDCKYGWDVEDNVIRLSLLRGSIRPDPDSDLGEHTFTYSLYPHPNTCHDTYTAEAACELNAPLSAIVTTDRHGGDEPETRSFVAADRYGVHIGALKPAEDGDGVILRLAEQHGVQCDFAVTFDRPIDSAEACDLLERKTADVKTKGNELRTALAPFEIKTFRIRFDEPKTGASG